MCWRSWDSMTYGIEDLEQDTNHHCVRINFMLKNCIETLSRSFSGPNWHQHLSLLPILFEILVAPFTFVSSKKSHWDLMTTYMCGWIHARTSRKISIFIDCNGFGLTVLNKHGVGHGTNEWLSTQFAKNVKKMWDSIALLGKVIFVYYKDCRQ